MVRMLQLKACTTGRPSKLHRKLLTYFPTGFPDQVKPVSNSCSLCRDLYVSTKFPLLKVHKEMIELEAVSRFPQYIQTEHTGI